MCLILRNMALWMKLDMQLPGPWKATGSKSRCKPREHKRATVLFWICLTGGNTGNASLYCRHGACACHITCDTSPSLLAQLTHHICLWNVNRKRGTS